MHRNKRRLLEMAGLLRRNTPDHMLFEGDDEGGGDDIFGDDGGDEGGGDDIFGDDGGDDGGGDAGGEEGGEERIPPEELSADDIEKFGSPRFLDIETNIKNMFNDAMTSAGAASQNNEFYPGEAIPEEAEDTPAKSDEPEEAAGDEGEDEGDDEANESFYRYGNRRDKWLINEATRLLLEAEEEGSAADVFDMERFCTELANYMDNIHNTEDVEAGIFNGARQMILNNFGPETENEFIQMLGSVASKQYKFLQTGFEDQQEDHVAVGAGGPGGGAA